MNATNPESLGWTVENTGGGCEAYRYPSYADAPDASYILATNDAGLPDPGEDVVLGVYGPDTTEGGVCLAYRVVTWSQFVDDVDAEGWTRVLGI